MENSFYFFIKHKLKYVRICLKKKSMREINLDDQMVLRSRDYDL